jgi:hypothetical protein
MFAEMENKLFNERGEWMEEKQKLIEELEMLRENKVGTEFANQLMLDI